MAPVSTKASKIASAQRTQPRPPPPASSSANKPEAKPSPSPANAPADKFERAAKSTGAAPTQSVSSRSTQNFSSNARNDIQRLAESRKAAISTNKDGSVTRSQTTQSGQTTRSQELTTSKGPLGKADLRYETSSRTGNREVNNTYTAQSDVLGRTQSTHQRQVTVERGNTTDTRSRTEAIDRSGNKKITQAESQTRTRGNNSDTRSSSVTTDALGNRAWSQETKSTTTNGNTTVTRTQKQSGGTERTVSSTSGMEEGRYTAGRSVDVNSSRFNTERTYSHERQVRPSTQDNGFSQAQRSDRLSRAQQVGDVLGAAGARTEILGGQVPADRMRENDRSRDPNTFIGTRHGVSGSQGVSIGADGITAHYNREAKAGVYAERTGSTKGRYGEASYGANAQVEAKASFDAQANLDANGLDASVNARAGVGAEAKLNGKAQTEVGTFAGVPINVSVEGTARVSAEASAEAKGRVQVTRNPPTAIAEGSVGASAVLKAEADGRASAGPFSVSGNVYGSLGAEATFGGVAGYEDGKMRLGANLGAAVGAGGGAGFHVEVDVAQIAEMAKNTADVNNDGRVGLDDARAAVDTARDAVADTARDVGNTLGNAADRVSDFFGF